MDRRISRTFWQERAQRASDPRSTTLDRQPAGSNYVPPHVKDGKLIPGHFK